MGWIKDTKTAAVAGSAQKAWETGQRYFTPIINMPATAPTMSGGVLDWPPMLEAIEAAGWKLHTWALVSDAKGRPQAMPLYVRP